ncbi:DUF6701 domain-containing protein [Paraglaciecola sp. 2405UD69-4]|uniref:DUF6701 domain-containing protein n=1 Tax=Paraglaciecola sp. 2405UD69-4 TaxID=3391836 RepID=UPI0039C9D2CA
MKLTRKILVLLISSLTQFSILATECTAVFPDGASTHSDNGKIFFGYNAQLIGSEDNLLATSAISKNSGSIKGTCEIIDCVATGSPSTPAEVVTFQTSSSSQDINLNYRDTVIVGDGAYQDNEFDDINRNNASEAVIRFSTNHTEYFVDRLTLAYRNTLYLQAGSTYWINQLNLNQSEIIVEGSGTANLYVNQPLNFPSPMLVNSPSINNSGDASKLVMRVFSNVFFNNNTTFTGSLYVDGDLNLSSSSYIFGAVSAEDIELGTDSTITYQGDEISDTDFGGICNANILPVAEYRLDEFSYSDVDDEVIESIGGYHGRAKSSQPIDGKLCNAIDLSASGTSDYIILDEDILTGRTDFTVSIWSKTSKQSSQSILSGAGENRNDFLMWFTDKDSFRPYLKDRQNGSITTTTIADNEWHHLVWTREGNQSCIYRDSVLQGCVTQSRDPLEIQSLILGQEQDSIGGRFSSSQAYDGLLDELLVFDGALSQNEITSIYTNQNSGLNYDGTARKCPSKPIVEYRFDEQSWNGTTNEVLDNIGEINGTSVAGANTITDGQVCRAGTFDGNNYINTPGISDPLSTTASFAFWIKTRQVGLVTAWLAPGIVGTEHRGGANDIFWGYLDKDGYIRLQRGNGVSIDSITAVNDGNWHHVAMTWDSETGAVQTFINGKLENSGITTAGNVTRTFSSIGRIENSFSDSNFIGELDELLIFDTVISESRVNSIYNNQLNGKNYDGSERICPPPPVDHYEIHHDSNGFTCESESVTIKACANEDCTELYTDIVSLTLSPSGWEGGNEISFTGGQTTANLSITDEGTVELGKTVAVPDVDLVCYNGATETCEMTFSNAGFELFGENIGDPLPDQVSASNFSNVNIRAIKDNLGVCEALLVGEHDISVNYNCSSPSSCVTPFAGIPITNPAGDNTGTLAVEFNSEGIASLSSYNYPDAGQVNLSVSAVIEGVTFNQSDIEPLDNYPSYLSLNVLESELVYGGSANEDNYVAGEPFTFIVGAYGVNDQLLPNYQGQEPQIKVARLAPATSGQNGIFSYSSNGNTNATLYASFNDALGLNFSGGEHRFATSYYDEVGRIEIDIRDNNYLDNTIVTNDTLILGNFYPAYYKASILQTPALADTCSVFSYIGQEISFDTNPEITIQAYNALDQVTSNYSANLWKFYPNEAHLENNLSYMDSSSYNTVGSAQVLDQGDEPLVTSINNYDGTGTLTIENGLFMYDKVNPTTLQKYGPVSPFEASIDLVFASDFFTHSFTDQNGNLDNICYQASYTSNTCLNLTISDITGTEMRDGRLALESTYGPETEALNVPIKAEYFNNGQWLLNSDDSNCTSIAFQESANHLSLSSAGSTDLTDDIASISSTGSLLFGVADDSSDLLLNAPGTVGELILQLDPVNDPTGWATYLNFDWDGDGDIDTDDKPQATITFGLFRGNDKVIQWRELF